MNIIIFILKVLSINKSVFSKTFIFAERVSSIMAILKTL